MLTRFFVRIPRILRRLNKPAAETRLGMLRRRKSPEESESTMLAPTKPSVHSPALDLYGHLQQSRLFASLTDDRLRQLVGRASLRKLPEKAPLALPSAESQTVHVVLSGRAKVCYLTQDGKQPILYFVDRGELVGEQLILSQGDGVEYVETVEPSLVANVSARYLRELMLDDPGFAASLSDMASPGKAG